MCVNHVEGIATVYFANSTHQTRRGKTSRNWKPDVTGKRKVLFPSNRRRCYMRASIPAIKRLDCDDLGLYELGLHLVQWLGDKTALGRVLLRGIERCQRKNTQW